MDLFTHQQDAVKWMVQQEQVPDEYGIQGGLLCDEMGLGKTRTCLATIRAVPVMTIVVCPVSLVKQWEQEAVTFLKQPVCTIVRASEAISCLTASHRHQLVIISHTCLTKLHDMHMMYQYAFGRLIIDEAHKAKSMSSALWKSVTQIKATRRWIVTGTPIVTTTIPARSATTTQHVSKDLRSYLRILRPDISSQSIRLIEQCPKIWHRFLMRRKKDIFQLPPIRTEVIEETLTYQEEHIYNAVYGQGVRIIEETQKTQKTQKTQTTQAQCQVEDDLLKCLEEIATRDADDLGGSADSDTDSTTFTRSLLLPIMMELRRICATSLSKMDQFEHDIRQQAQPYSRSLVFCSFIDEITMTSERAQRHVDVVMEFHGKVSLSDRQEMIDVFMQTKDPRSMCLIIQISCGGCGLNIQAATHVFLMSPSWSAAVEDQAIARAHRVNTRHCVFVKKYIMRGTLETYMHTRTNQKRKTASVLLQEPRSYDAASECVMWKEGHKLFEDEQPCI